MVRSHLCLLLHSIISISKIMVRFRVKKLLLLFPFDRHAAFTLRSWVQDQGRSNWYHSELHSLIQVRSLMAPKGKTMTGGFKKTVHKKKFVTSTAGLRSMHTHEARDVEHIHGDVRREKESSTLLCMCIYTQSH